MLRSMLQKDIKNRILKLIYKEPGRPQWSSDDFIREIPEATEDQLEMAADSLNQSSMFAQYTPILGGHFIIGGLSGKGMEYVEENLLSEDEKELDELSDFTKLGKEGLEKEMDTSKDSIPNVYFPKTSSEKYKPLINNDIQKDADVNPCFGVDTLAKCFVKLIDSVSQAKSSNISMLGIFAPWGRGKTYFFSRVKEALKKYTSVKYKVVTFNAWKYQETPAIWAYLFETFKSRLLNLFTRVIFNIKRNRTRLLWSSFVFTCPFIAAVIFKDDLPSNSEIVVGIASVIGFVIKTIYDNTDAVEHWGRKLFTEVAFEKELGVQAKIEKELEALLRFKICKTKTKSKQVLLYVDDIDRCDHSRIVSIIESLRTVLENEEIGKRLVVVCSLDISILKSALSKKYESLVDPMKLNNVVRDQIDKIFVSSISLPQLKFAEYEEYLMELSGTEYIDDFQEIKQKYSSKPGNEAKPSDVTVEINSMDLERLVKIISEEVSEKYYRLTPRQLKVLYYRCLFAMDLYAKRDELFERKCINDIIEKSYGNETESPGNDFFNEIASIVVPM